MTPLELINLFLCSLYGWSRHLNSTLKLREHFNKPGVLHQDGRLDQLLRTMATQNAQKVDLVHTEEVCVKLFIT